MDYGRYEVLLHIVVLALKIEMSISAKIGLGHMSMFEILWTYLSQVNFCNNLHVPMECFLQPLKFIYKLYIQPFFYTQFY